MTRSTSVLALGLALTLAPTSAHALDVLHVPGDFATLQDALDAAAPDDTIVIDGGEHLYTRIEKPVTLVGRAANEPYLTVDAGGVTTSPGSDPEQFPALVIDDPGGLVTLVGVKVGGVTSATTVPHTSGSLTASGAGDVRVLHSTVRAVAFVEGAEFALGSGTMGVGFGIDSLTVVDSRVLGAGHLSTAFYYCYQNLHPSFSGLGVFTNRPPVLLDSEVLGGSSYKNAGYGPSCDGITSYVPASCDELSGGMGGTALAVQGDAWVADTTLTGGRGATVFWDGDAPPPGFPCAKPSGAPFSGDQLVELGNGVALSSSGAMVENRPWSLSWEVGEGAILLMGPALVEPQTRPGDTALFVDPDEITIRPIPQAGAGSMSGNVGALDEALLGKVMAFQIYTPGEGLSRPVLTAFQPQ